VATVALGYAAIVLFDRPLFGHWFGWRSVIPLFAVATFGAWFGTGRIVARVPASARAFVNASLLLGTLVCCLVIADTVVAGYVASKEPAAVDVEPDADRDPVPFANELHPRYYFPSSQFFRIYKPGTTVTGDHFGMLYFHRLAQSRTLRDSVFRLHHVTMSISADGIRDRDAIDKCHVAAIGDSFTFGVGVTDGATWPDLLEPRIGGCVLNFGLSGAGPMEEVVAFRHHMQAHAGRASIHTIVWTIYEGNDLEDARFNTAPTPSASGPWSRIRDATVLGGAYALVRSIRDQSVVGRLLDGSLNWAARAHPLRQHPLLMAFGSTIRCSTQRPAAT
jgi:hypothetical protein